MSRIGALKYERSNSFAQPKMSVKCPFITNLAPGKVEKENHIRKVQKSEERKVKTIGKIYLLVGITKCFGPNLSILF